MAALLFGMDQLWQLCVCVCVGGGGVGVWVGKFLSSVRQSGEAHQINEGDVDEETSSKCKDPRVSLLTLRSSCHAHKESQNSSES